MSINYRETKEYEYYSLVDGGIGSKLIKDFAMF